MKRKVLAVLLLLLIILLPGCGKRGKIGICMRQMDAGVSAQLASILSDSLQSAGQQVVAVDAFSDQAKQNSQISQLIAEEYDLLIVEPVMTAEAAGIVQMAKEAKIPVIFMNYEPEETVLNSWEQACYVGCDLARPGAVQAELVTALADGGDINADGSTACMVISGPEDHMDASLWTDTCTQMPTFQCLATQCGDWTRESGEKIGRKYLAQYGKDLEVIFCSSDEMALGALDAIRDGGRTVGENIHLIGIGADWQALVLVKSGDMTGTVCPDIFGISQQVTETARQLLSGKTPEKRVLLDFVAVTAGNVEEFLIQ